MKNESYHLWNPFTDMDSLLKHLGIGPTVISGGEGIYVTNQQGEKFINGFSSLWNVAIGLGREELVEAATQQMRELAFASCFRQTHPKAVELAAKLVEITGGHFQQVYLGSNGSEAVEAALKIARQFWGQSKNKNERGKRKVLSLRNSYHGVSYGAISTSGLATDEEKYGPLLEGFEQIDPPYCYRCPYGKKRFPECGLACADALDEKIQQEKAETVAAFILEPIMGVHGIISPPVEYYARIGEICQRHQVLLIADEVTTGFGRTGKLFESQDWQPQPDILVLGKAISSGYLPLSATLVTADIYARFQGPGRQLDHGSTASGHPVCAAVGLANIEIILRERLAQRAAESGEILKSGLLELMESSSVMGEVRGRGLMLGIELVQDRESKEPLAPLEVTRHLTDLANLGLLGFRTGNVIGLMPPLVIEPAVVEKILEIVGRGLASGMKAQLGRKARVVKGKAKALLQRSDLTR